MHFRVRSSEGQRVTTDCGVAATFERQDTNGPVGNVTNIEEILELDYQSHCVVVLLCKWMKAKYNGPSPTIIRDDLGFTVANFNNMLELGKESFAFPIHYQQVFFSDDPSRPGWKVVCRTDVSGRQRDLHYARADIDMLVVGLDASYEGLQPRAPAPTGTAPSTSTASERPQQGRHISRAHAAAEFHSDSKDDEAFGDWLS
jgi:hypothetical protein